MELARSVIGVVTVFALLGILLWISRKKGALFSARRPSSGAGELELLQRLPLTANHSVHLLRAGEKTLLVGTHGSGLTVLCDLSKPVPPQL